MSIHTDSDVFPPAAATPETGSPRLPPRMRVLCVDDNQDAADSLGTMLDLAGCETAVAHDGPSAIALADAFRPQVCLLDITMPGMDGCELAAALRNRPDGESLLLVALTALNDYASLERMADAGFDLHYPKPVAPSTVYATLNDFAARGRPT